MYFNDEITSVQLVLLIVGVFLMLLSVVAILFRTIPLKRYVKRAKQNILHLEGSLPAASVIIFAHDDSNSLAEMLPQVLSQNYTGDFEVIVVNDGKSPDVKDITEHFMLSHRNLYFTAAPDGARNLSRKKLALTLGIKAAKSPIVVHTTSAARVNSPQWLNNIMKHFAANPEVDVVIGFSSAPPYDDNGFGARARSFDAVADSIGWVVPAINGSAWRGTEHNLAYRRKAFFDNKGFSRHLNLRDGDDDIFVNEIVNRNNTIFELSPDTVVDVPGDNNSREMRERFARRRFTRRFIQNRTCFAGTIFVTPLQLPLRVR